MSSNEARVAREADSCAICGNKRSEFPMINRNEETCSENCKANLENARKWQADLDERVKTIASVEPFQLPSEEKAGERRSTCVHCKCPIHFSVVMDRWVHTGESIGYVFCKTGFTRLFSSSKATPGPVTWRNS